MSRPEVIVKSRDRSDEAPVAVLPLATAIPIGVCLWLLIGLALRAAGVL